MKRMIVCKAEPIGGNIIEDVELHIKGKLPSMETKQLKSLKDVEEIYKTEALNVFDVLSKHLPQGTRHQLLILMLKDAQNLYRGI